MSLYYVTLNMACVAECNIRTILFWYYSVPYKTICLISLFNLVISYNNDISYYRTCFISIDKPRNSNSTVSRMSQSITYYISSILCVLIQKCNIDILIMFINNHIRKVILRFLRVMCNVYVGWLWEQLCQIGNWNCQFMLVIVFTI